MLPRYYQVPPRVQGPVEWLAGFLRGRQDVHAQEAGLDAAQERQNQELYAQGLQGLGQPIFQAAAMQFGARQDAARQAAISQAAQQLERLRQLGGMWENAQSAYQSQYGAAPPDLAGAPMAPMPSAAGQVPFAPVAGGPLAGAAEVVGPPTARQAMQAIAGETALGPPAPPQSGVPGPALDPAAVPAYQEGKRRLDQLLAYKATIDTNPWLTPEDRSQQLATLAPHVAAAQGVLSRFPRPKPPTTFDELIQTGEMIPIDGSTQFALKRPNGWEVSREVNFASQTQQPMDFDGLRRAGLIVPGPKNGQWLIRDPKDGSLREMNFKEQETARGKLFNSLIEAKDPTTGELLVLREGGLAQALQAAAAMETAQGLPDMTTDLLKRRGTGSITMDDATVFGSALVQVYGSRENLQKQSPGLAALADSIATEAAMNAPVVELAPTPPELIGPPEAPVLPSPGVAGPTAGEVAKELFNRSTVGRNLAGAGQALEAGIEAIPSPSRARPFSAFGFLGRKLMERPAIGQDVLNRLSERNRKASPTGQVTAITPDRELVTYARNELTPDVIARLKAQGYRIPGLDE